jgi:dolichyl-phosphate-mannose-protein mannosyltransferase
MNVHDSAMHAARPRSEWILAGTALVAFTFAVTKVLGDLSLDLWWDEVVFLRQYVVPFSALPPRFDPNHHVPLALALRPLAAALGPNYLEQMLGQPWVARCLPAIFSVATPIVLWALARRRFGPSVATLSVILLVTTLPFYNFAVQVRGYSLSFLLGALSLPLLHPTDEESPPRLRDFVLGAMLVLTLISNAYFLLSLTVAVAVSDLLRRGSLPPRPLSRRLVIVDRRLARALLAGLGGLAAVGLLLAWYGALSSSYLQSGGFGRASILTGTLPRVAYSYLSRRYLLVPVLLLGLDRAWRSGDRQRAAALAGMSVLLGGPLMASFLRGDAPAYDRIHLTTLPVFCLLCAILIDEALGRLRPRWQLLGVVGVVVYCGLVVGATQRFVDQRLRQDLSTGGMQTNLMFNFYRFRFQPSHVIRLLQARESPSEPVLVYEADQAAMPAYLRKAGIPFYRICPAESDLVYATVSGTLCRRGLLEREHPPSSGERIQTAATRWIVTAFGPRFEATMLERYPELRCQRLNSELEFHNVYRCDAVADRPSAELQSGLAGRLGARVE